MSRRSTARTTSPRSSPSAPWAPRPPSGTWAAPWACRYADTDRVARLVPNALHMTIERALEENPELRSLYEMDEQVRNLVETAQKLEGLSRHASTHAAGVVISREPLVEHVPLQRPARAATATPPSP